MKIENMKELIQFDRKIQKEVEEAYQKKSEIKKKIDEEKEILSKKAWDEVEKEVNQMKEKLDKKIQESASINETEYKKRVKSLQEQYNSQKELWINKIVSQCIK